MPGRHKAQYFRHLWAVVGFCTAVAGCQTLPPPPSYNPMPRELRKTALPPYVIETPDILSIDLPNAVPKPPYIIKVSDSLTINVPSASHVGSNLFP